jgi:hypothetical protein
MTLQILQKNESGFSTTADVPAVIAFRGTPASGQSRHFDQTPMTSGLRR